MPVPQIPTSISNMVDLITFLNNFYAGMQEGVNPPPIVGWEVVFTRKVVAGTAADQAAVPTGHTYDGSYEYLVGVGTKSSPSANPTAPVVISDVTLETLPAMWQKTCADYRPDGTSLCAMVFTRIAPQTNPAAIPGGGPGGAALTLISEMTDGVPSWVKIDIDYLGAFSTKWEGDQNNDGHCVIARRKRYG